MDTLARLRRASRDWRPGAVRHTLRHGTGLTF